MPPPPGPCARIMPRVVCDCTRRDPTPDPRGRPVSVGHQRRPRLIARNVEAMTETSLQLFRRGHLPVMGEWFALPLIEQRLEEHRRCRLRRDLSSDLAPARGQVRRVPAYRRRVGGRRRDGAAGAASTAGRYSLDRRRPRQHPLGWPRPSLRPLVMRTAIGGHRLRLAALGSGSALVLCWVLRGGGAGAAAAGQAQAAPAAGPALRWYKGNTHTHTLNSDGDSTPDEVVRWYREHGYQFLVLTDHNFLTEVDGLNALHGADERFLVIRGEEVTARRRRQADARQRPGRRTAGRAAHGRLGRRRPAARRRRDPQRDGVPHINHPNFGWAITGRGAAAGPQQQAVRDLQRPSAGQQRGRRRRARPRGGVGRILSSGTLLYGIAVDDAHDFKQPGNPQASRARAAAG